MPNAFRKILAAQIAANGGYCRGRWDTYPLAWNVKVAYFWPSLQEIMPKVEQALQEEFGLALTAVNALVQQVSAPHTSEEVAAVSVKILLKGWLSADGMSERVLENMCNQLDGTDTYKFLSPAREKAFGVSTPDEGFAAEFGFVGRMGGHLVLLNFEGKRLQGTSPRELLDSLQPDSGAGAPTNCWVQKLAAFVAECDEMFSKKAVQEEYLYQIAYLLAESLSNLHDLLLSQEKERVECLYWAEKERVECLYWAERDVMTV